MNTESMLSDKPYGEMLGPDEAKEGLTAVAISAKKTGIRVALCGGVAMVVYGSDRNTKDIDVIATGEPGLAIENHLTIGGVRVRSPLGVPIDVIIPEGEVAAFFQTALETAVPNKFIQIPIVTPEYLALMKYLALRPKDELDLAWLLESGNVAYEQVLALAKQHFGPVAVRDFKNRKLKADWINERNRRAEQNKYKNGQER